MNRICTTFLPAACVAVVIISGCAAPQKPRDYPPVAAPPVAEYSRGSLWQQTSRGLAEDMKARRVGDLITVIINESASASKEASTGTSRGSSISAGIPNLLGLETQLTGMKQWINADKLVSANYDSSFAGKGATSRKESLNATVAAVVVQVYSNGTLKIEGRRSVKVNGEEQMIVLEGVARARDITPENTISSAYLADAKINYSGKGVISDRQEPGFLMWIIDSLWPF